MESQNKYMSRKAVQQSHLLLIIACLFTMFLASAAVAEESHETDEHAFHKHHASLIVGGVVDEHGENDLSAGIGVDYEYRFNQWLGLGGLAEYAGGDFEHVLLGIPLFIHPYENWRLAVAAATEVHNDEEHDERKREWVVRAGVGYAFHVGDGYSISPEFYADFSEHETLYVIGLAIGFGW